MKLDLPYLIVLTLLVLAAVSWLGALMFGLFTLHWPGIIIMILVGLLVIVLAMLLVQRLRSREDDYYSKKIKR